jgi:amino acid permease
MVEINSIEMVQDMTMKKVTLLFVATTMLYMLCGCIGYAAFGDNAPEKLVEAANAAIAIHSVGALGTQLLVTMHQKSWLRLPMLPLPSTQLVHIK